MSTITFDFRHYYRKGERRGSEQIAYQWDLGHIAEIYVPANATYEIHYCFSDYQKTDDYAIESTGAAEDGGYKLSAHIPNKYFERSGELRVYVIGSIDGHILTTYEGFITIRGRLQPDDYTDPDPENGAETIIQKASDFADESEAWAVGQINGADVPSTEEQYQNNSKYWAGRSAASATASAASAVESSGYATDASGSAQQAAGFASAASSYASQAANSMNIADQAAGAAFEQAQSASTAAATATTKAGEAAASAQQAAASLANVLGNFATVEPSSTASKAYKIDEYLIFDQLLYRVTAAIASGGTINPGTNCVQTTVGEEVARIRDEEANRTLWWESLAVASTGGSAGTLLTITDSRITADHILDKFVANNPSVITSDISCVASAGQALITGTSTAATSAEIKLTKKDN